MIEITSTKNPLIKEIKTLYKKKGRQKTGLFIIEGIKIIKEAIDYDYDLKNIIYTDELKRTKEGEGFLKEIESLNNLIYVPENIFKEISDTENPQGIIALAKIDYKSLDEIKNIKENLFIYLDELQDPGNMGTIIRTGDAFNIGGIIITEGCVDPYNPKVVRSTMGSIFRIPIYYAEDGVLDLRKLKEKGLRIFSTSLEASESLFHTNLKDGGIITIGNESKGVSAEVFTLSDQLIKIPMPGKAESLNAGVAASIIMYETMKQRI